jgi:acyl dehydratase
VNLAALRAHRFPSQRVRYGAMEAMRYALSVGVGSDPLDEAQLRMVYERQLLVLPTFATVLAQQSAWLADPRFEVKFLQVLHGEEQLLMQRPLPAEAEVLAHYEVLAVVDKGEGKGAVVYFQKQLCEALGNEPLCTVTSTLFLRGDGGCGSYGGAPGSPGAMAGGPLTAADPADQGAQRWHDQLTTAPNAALLYRLNGDLNPLHADPAAARAAGFERPILHGLCTYGIAAQLLIRQVCAGDPTRLRAFGARFSSPVYPGESLNIEVSRGGAGLQFRASVPERNQLVLSHGYATIA